MGVIRGIVTLPLAGIMVVLVILAVPIILMVDITELYMRTRSLKYALWWVGLFPRTRCPYCGSETMAHGFEPHPYYTCQNQECRFNQILIRSTSAA